MIASTLLVAVIVGALVLGSATFVLVSLVPLVIRQTARSTRGLGEIQRLPGSRFFVWSGAAATALLYAVGVLGILLYSFSPVVDIAGIERVLTDSTGDWMLAGLFLGGGIAGLLFMLADIRIMRGLARQGIA